MPERHVLEADDRRCAHDAREARDPLGDLRVALVRHRRRALHARRRTAPRPRAPRCGRGGGSRSRTCRATSRTVRARSSSSAWRSRAITCVETGSGSRPRRSQAMRSTSGSIAAYVPTVPESWPTRHVSSAPLEPRAGAVELERPARELPAERRRLGVDAVRAADADRLPVLLGAPDDCAESRVDAARIGRPRRGSAARATCRRRPTTSARSAPTGPRARAARRRRRRRRRGRGRSSPRSRKRVPVSARWRRRGSLRRRPQARLRPRPSRPAPPARPRTSAPACPAPTRSGSSPDGSSGRSLRTV